MGIWERMRRVAGVDDDMWNGKLGSEFMGRAKPLRPQLYARSWEQIACNYTLPYGTLLKTCGENGIPLGLFKTETAYAMPQSSVLILGPPRTGFKTAGSLMLTTLTSYHPTVVVTTKRDVAMETALVRSMVGRVYWYSPQEPAPRGFEQLYWNPLYGCETYSAALSKAKSMSEAAGMAHSGDGNAAYFEKRGHMFLAACMNYAATHQLTMRDVTEAIFRMDWKKLMVWSEVSKGSTKLGFETVLQSTSREQTGVLSTLSTVLEAYLDENVLANACAKRAFDPERFVTPSTLTAQNLWHQTETGPKQRLRQHDTVYIVADNADVTAPIVSDLVKTIADATMKAHVKDHTTETVFVLDELAHIPLPELPKWLATGGSQGIRIHGAIQDFTQLEHRWEKQAEAFPTLFNHLLVRPGIRDMKTLEMVSKLVGEHKVETVTFNETRNQWGGKEINQGWGSEWRPILTPAQINAGHKNDEQMMLMLVNGASRAGNANWWWVRQMRYYDDYPLTGIIAHAALWGHSQNTDLPFPQLSMRAVREMFPQYAVEYEQRKEIGR